MRAAIIGDDSRIAGLALQAIRLRWPEVSPVVVTSEAAALDMLSRESLDVVLLHPIRSEGTLIDFIRDMRKLTDVPLLVLSDQGYETELVTALEVGAEDYIRLPCGCPEIMIRIWAVLRRSGHGASPEEDGRHLHSGPLSLYPAAYEASLNGQRLPLTTTEFKLLHLLLEHQDEIVAHQTVERTLWAGRSNSAVLAKKYLQRLRKKLGDDARYPQWIVTVHGVGYRLVRRPDIRASNAPLTPAAETIGNSSRLAEPVVAGAPRWPVRTRFN